MAPSTRRRRYLGAVIDRPDTKVSHIMKGDEILLLPEPYSSAQHSFFFRCTIFCVVPSRTHHVLTNTHRYRHAQANPFRLGCLFSLALFSTRHNRFASVGPASRNLSNVFRSSSDGRLQPRASIILHSTSFLVCHITDRSDKRQRFFSQLIVSPQHTPASNVPQPTHRPRRCFYLDHPRSTRP